MLHQPSPTNKKKASYPKVIISLRLRLQKLEKKQKICEIVPMNSISGPMLGQLRRASYGGPFGRLRFLPDGDVSIFSLIFHPRSMGK